MSKNVKYKNNEGNRRTLLFVLLNYFFLILGLSDCVPAMMRMTFFLFYMCFSSSTKREKTEVINKNTSINFPESSWIYSFVSIYIEFKTLLFFWCIFTAPRSHKNAYMSMPSLAVLRITPARVWGSFGGARDQVWIICVQGYNDCIICPVLNLFASYLAWFYFCHHGWKFYNTVNKNGFVKKTFQHHHNPIRVSILFTAVLVISPHH